ncbi:uncharacterized protein LOC105662033 [Megachile rotundata]|uniref:uncharacterized protein LOC105662033 n=1 Tax=Megachile rotundata TaxID=143995 RepID=UPI003FCFBACC
MKILILFTMLAIPDCYASARTHSDSQKSGESTTVFHVTKNITNDQIIPNKMYLTNKDDLKYLYSQNVKQREVLSKLFPKLFDLLEESGKHRKRSTDNVNRKRNMSRKKQKKAKALGRLLMNNAASKNYDDIQDDYIDEDDDYWTGVNRKKMKWEDYRNEDGASVMELIALNARHKTNLRHAENTF